MVPVIGVAADAVDALIYIGEGNYAQAALTMAPELMGGGVAAV